MERVPQKESLVWVVMVGRGTSGDSSVAKSNTGRPEKAAGRLKAGAA